MGQVMQRAAWSLSLIAVAISVGPSCAAEPAVAFTEEEGKVQIEIAGRPFAAYVFRDEQIFRPYFAHVRAPNGVQVSRNHPPVEGRDATDHALLHPGLWLAFGNLGGSDFWRNRAAVRHVEFVEKAQGGAGIGKFAVKNRYEANGKLICEEVCRISLRVWPAGYLLLWDSAFEGASDFGFGDQEEMGLGVRVATPLSVKRGGRITNSDGRTNEKQVWGKQGDWCAYEGEIDGRRVGVLLLPHPKNFRRSWFHARDYGLLVANPFGRNAFTRGEKSWISVKKGEAFRLRFGVLVYAGRVDLSTAYRDYLGVAR